MNLRESLGVLFIIVLFIYGFSTNFSVGRSNPNRSNTVHVSNDMPFVSLRKNLEFFADESREIGLEELVEGFYAEQFKALDLSSSGQGYTQDWLWYRVELHNEELETLKLIVEIRYPIIDYIEGYLVESLPEGENAALTIIQSFSVGDRYGYYDRPIETPYFTQPLNFSENKVWLYLKVRTSSSVALPIYIGGYDSYIADTVYRQWGLGILYGIAIALIFYNVVLFISLKDPVHLYYALFTTGLFMYFACIDGYAYKLWPNSIEWQTKAYIYIVYVTLFFSVLFSRRFLGINRNLDAYYHSTNGLLFLCAFSVSATPFLEEVYASLIMSLCIFIVTIYLFFLGIRRMRDGAPMSDFYVVIWGSMLVITLFSVISSFGYLFVFEQIQGVMKAISVVQLVFLSIVVGYKLNAMRYKQIRAEQHARRFSQEARKAEKELLGSQIESNKLLENRVLERTLQLEEALENLSDLNEKLTRLSEIDSLTGLYNRRKLELEYDRIIESVKGSDEVIGFLFVDIDHFKRFNDTYGHEVGDECLRQVSTMMRRFSEKYALISGRLGGEEFVLLDQKSNALRLQEIAEKFRAAIAREKFLHRGHELNVTVSIGGYLPSPSNQLNRSFVMREADDALYQAKESGRNCVVVRLYDSQNPSQIDKT